MIMVWLVEFEWQSTLLDGDHSSRRHAKWFQAGCPPVHIQDMDMISWDTENSKIQNMGTSWIRLIINLFLCRLMLFVYRMDF